MEIRPWWDRNQDDVEYNILYQVGDYRKPIIDKFDIVSVTEPHLFTLSNSDRYVIRFYITEEQQKYIYTLPKGLSAEERQKLAEELLIIVKLMG